MTGYQVEISLPIYILTQICGREKTFSIVNFLLHNVVGEKL